MLTAWAFAIQTASVAIRLLASLLIILSTAQAYDPLEYESQQDEIPKQFKDVGITEKKGVDLKKIPIELVNENGEKKPLSFYLTRGRPTLLSLVYYSCPSLCNLHLNGVLDALKQLSLVAGKDYEMVAVSFDPREDHELAAAKKFSYQEKFGFPNEGVHFLTGDESTLKTLAESVGFKYKWDDKAKEWAHASAAVLLTPDGIISRYLHGVYFEPKTFRLSIVEASEGKVGTIVDSVTLFCFRYDPKGNQYAFYAFNLVRLGCVVITILMFFLLYRFWKKQAPERR